MIQLQSITEERFKPFGVVIKHPNASSEPFNIIISETQQPWRIATYKINDKTAQRLECHNESLESFEPLDGLGLLLVAMHDKPEAIQAFILDTPVCLHKGVWHQLLAITDDVTVKIMENLEVSSDFFILEPPLTLALT